MSTVNWSNEQAVQEFETEQRREREQAEAEHRQSWQEGRSAEAAIDRALREQTVELEVVPGIIGEFTEPDAAESERLALFDDWLSNIDPSADDVADRFEEGLGYIDEVLERRCVALRDDQGELELDDWLSRLMVSRRITLATKLANAQSISEEEIRKFREEQLR